MIIFQKISHELYFFISFVCWNITQNIIFTLKTKKPKWINRTKTIYALVWCMRILVVIIWPPKACSTFLPKDTCTNNKCETLTWFLDNYLVQRSLQVITNLLWYSKWSSGKIQFSAKMGKKRMVQFLYWSALKKNLC